MFGDEWSVSKVLRIIMVIPIIFDLVTKIYKFFRKEKNE